MAFKDIFKDSNEYNEKNNRWIRIICGYGSICRSRYSNGYNGKTIGN
jgi:hypothetical protein